MIGPSPHGLDPMGSKSGTDQVKGGVATTAETSTRALTAEVADARLEGIELHPDAISILEQLGAGHIHSDTAGRELLAGHGITAPAGHPFT